MLMLGQRDPPGPADRIVDDRLRLIFACCHPALDPGARVALTLRTLCGLSTAEIARSDREFAVTVPPREYELAARLLVQAVEADPSGRSRAALAEAAHRLGTELGSASRSRQDVPGRDVPGRDVPGQDVPGQDVLSALAQQGYEPDRDGDGVIRLRNCPFHQLAERHRELVCGMNLALVEGLVKGLGTGGWHPVLDSRPGHCCVAIGGDRP